MKVGLLVDLLKELDQDQEIVLAVDGGYEEMPYYVDMMFISKLDDCRETYIRENGDIDKYKTYPFPEDEKNYYILDATKHKHRRHDQRKLR